MREPANSQWFTYPQLVTGTSGKTERIGFVGLMTHDDPSFIPETACGAGQNTFDNDQDHISIRPFGSSIFPSTATPSVASGGYPSGYVFRLRTGENIMLVATATTLLWFDQTTKTFNNLRSSLTSGDFGFAEFNINSNAESRLYFGNGTETSGYWNGGHTLLNGALTGGEATINVDSTSSFTASGSLRIGTTTVTYTGVTATSFTGCAGTPAAADNLPIAQAVTLDTNIPKGNILMAAQNRLFVVPTANKQLIQFSAYGDATTWATTTVTFSTATAAGAFNLIEGGGRVTAMSQDEQSLYFYKDSMTYVANLTDSYYSIKPLKPFDGRSRAVGALGKRGVFTGGNFTFVVTPDKQIKGLQRVEYIDYPQLKPISHDIQPTCDALDFSSISGISFTHYAYFACKSSVSAATNDTVLAFNTVSEHWENPIIGWNVGEWMIYDDGTGEALYFTDAISPNVWKVDSTTLSDGPYIITASRLSKQYDFSMPSVLKELDDVFVEGYITPTTTLKIRLLLDDNGFTNIQETEFLGSETNYLLSAPVINSFGLTPFGTQRIGSNDDLTGAKKFRIHLKADFKRIPFYLAQLEFSSSGFNQYWEVTKYGFLVRVATQETRTKLIRSFT